MNLRRFPTAVLVGLVVTTLLCPSQAEHPAADSAAQAEQSRHHHTHPHHAGQHQAALHTDHRRHSQPQGGPQAAGGGANGGVRPGVHGAPDARARQLLGEEQEQPLELQQQPGGDARAGSGTRPRVPALTVAAMTLCMSLASGLGVLPFFFFGQLSPPWAGAANAVGSGVMIAASFGLMQEGGPYGGAYMVGGVMLGMLFVKLSQQYLDQYEIESFDELRGAEARQVILFLAVMAVHALGEGSGVGVSFAGERGWAQGTLVTLAIGLHNVPEGLTVATVMAAKGASPTRALLWTMLTSFPQAVVAVPAYLFVEAFKALLPLAMGFAAGCMLWIVFAELLPEALENLEHGAVASAATASAACLQGLSLLFSSLEQPNGTFASPFSFTGDAPSAWALLLGLLLPAVGGPGVLAAVAAGLLPSRPATLGLSAGVLCTLGAAALLQLLLGGSLGVLRMVALPSVGAAAAVALWRQLPGGSGRQLDGHSKKHDDGGAAGEPSGAGAGGQLANGRHAYPVVADGSWEVVAVSGKANGSGSLHRPVTPGAASAMNGAHPGYNGSAAANGAAPAGTPPQCHSQQPWQSALQQQLPTQPWLPSPPQQQQQVQQPLHQQQPYQQQQQQPYQQQLPYQQLQQQAGSYFFGSPGHDAPPQHVGTGAGQLAGDGDSVLPLSQAAGGHVSDWGTHRLLVLGVAALVAMGVPYGVLVADALVQGGNDGVSHVALPSTLAGCILGLASIGPLVPVLGPSPRRLAAAAAAVASSGPLSALLSLMAPPPGSGRRLQGAASLQALAAGFGLAAALLFLRPAAQRWHPRRAAAGFAAGSLAALVVSGASAAMCAATPYCLWPTLE